MKHNSAELKWKRIFTFKSHQHDMKSKWKHCFSEMETWLQCEWMYVYVCVRARVHGALEYAGISSRSYSCLAPSVLRLALDPSFSSVMGLLSEWICNKIFQTLFFLSCTLDDLHIVDIHILFLKSTGVILSAHSCFRKFCEAVLHKTSSCFHIADESEWGTWFTDQASLERKPICVRMCV